MTDTTAPVIALDTDLESGLSEAAAAIAQGRCVVFPTDTVYGIGANAFDAAAVQGLLDAKGRGREMPPPVLVAEPSMLRAIAHEVPKAALDLAKAFWPGPLTLVLRAQPKGGMDLGETRGTIAVRVPDHEDARALLRRTGPLAVSSANASGAPAALNCAEALEQLGDKVAVYLDGGRVSGAVASTIVDFAATPEGQVLRDGALSLEQLREVIATIQPMPEPEAAPQEPEPADEVASGEPSVAAADEVASVEPSVATDENAQPEPDESSREEPIAAASAEAEQA